MDIGEWMRQQEIDLWREIVESFENGDFTMSNQEMTPYEREEWESEGEATEEKKLSRADIVKLTNKLAATYLQHNLEDFKVVSECMDSGMTEKDAKRVEAQMLKLIERIRRA